MVEISRFAPPQFPRLARIPGVGAATASCAFKSAGQRDLLLIGLRPGSAVAGVFTRSTVTSAAVQSSKRSVRGGRARALVVHSGNANALTGRQGKVLVDRMCQAVGDALDCPPQEVLVAATGIIGQRVTDQQLLGHLPGLAGELGEVDWEQAVEAIRTTDTYSKGSSRTVAFGDRQVSVSGIAKGAGMIAPDMATMLCFLFTDAAVEPDELQRMLTYANARSFRRITVDGDESTSDTMLAFATGEVAPPEGGERGAALARLREALAEVAFDLAMQVVRDGEGISKFIKVTVSGARTDEDAYVMAKSIAESPLVKTAIAGGHANWGRIAMAIGKTHRPVDQERLAVWLGEHQVVVDGDQNDALDLDALTAYMSSDSIDITADVAMGHQSSTMWTCDLTHQYIDVNAYYLT